MRRMMGTLDKLSIIQHAAARSTPLTVIFAGASRAYRSGSAPSFKLAPMYVNTGVFRIGGDNRVICDGMPFSRHISKVSCILSSGTLVFGQYCRRCKRAIPHNWDNCPICAGKIEKKMTTEADYIEVDVKGEPIWQ